MPDDAAVVDVLKRKEIDEQVLRGLGIAVDEPEVCGKQHNGMASSSIPAAKRLSILQDAALMRTKAATL